MKTSTRATRLARFILVTACLILPTLSLLPLGGLYLWEKGWLLHWAVLALCVSGTIAFVETRLLRREVERQPKDAEPLPGPAGAPSAAWDAREMQAWRDVRTLAANIDIDGLDSSKAFLDLGLETITTVARRLHPETSDPLWQFTMPEAMAITERVSRRLSRAVVTHVPFGDRLTLAQFRAAYRWRGAVGVAERAYDIWRIVRLMNPATAIANEARERVSRAVLNWGREQVTRRLAETFVEEVGRAAIDLYGGRLRLPAPLAPEAVGAPVTATAEVASPSVPRTIDEVPITVSICGGTPASRAALRDHVLQLETSDGAATGPRLWPPMRVSGIDHDLRTTAGVDAAAQVAVATDVCLLLTAPQAGIEPHIGAFLSRLGQAAGASRVPRLKVVYPVAITADGAADPRSADDVVAFARARLAPPLVIVGLKPAVPGPVDAGARLLAYENGLWRSARLVLAHRRREATRASGRTSSIVASGVQGVTAAARSIRDLFRGRSSPPPG